MSWFWSSKKGEQEEEKQEAEGSSDSSNYDSSSEESEESSSQEEEEESQSSSDSQEVEEKSEEFSSQGSASESSSSRQSTEEEDEESSVTDAQHARLSIMKPMPPKASPNTNPFDDEFDESSSSEDDADEDDNDLSEEESEERIEAGVPDHVVGTRARAPSILSLGDDVIDDGDVSNASTEGDTDESVHSEVSQEQEHVTTLAEKQSLLVLAAEHDRVDIINSVLANAQDEDAKHELLHGGVPALHIAVLNGSINTATCLLRLGADPSLRPNIKEIAQNQDPQTPLDVPKQIDNTTAWELSFDKKVTPKAKRSGIMNAFMAEALRCMGTDEGDRLQQLLDAGMPPDLSMMGDKSLLEWATDLGAPKCQDVLRSSSQPNTEATPSKAPTSQGKSAVLDRPGSEKNAEQLTRQLEELESLAKALSTCLDSLAEEVSVSHGLLLMGGGGSALASHVRSLKATKEGKYEEFSRYQESLENTQDEMEYWVKKAGPKGKAIAAEETPVMLPRKTSLPNFNGKEEERDYSESLQKRIDATNDKIQKFRISIADLSEENNRNIQEVEKRGLTGGINLVRGLKDEIREIEFALEEMKVAETVYKTKIEKIQQYLNDSEANGAIVENKESAADASVASTEVHRNDGTSNGDALTATASDDSLMDSGDGAKPSERIASGKSREIVVRLRDGPGPGSFPLQLWQILLRIIGLRDTRITRPPQSGSSYNSQPPMTV